MVVVIDRQDIAYCAMASAHGIVDPMCIGVMRLIWGVWCLEGLIALAGAAAMALREGLGLRFIFDQCMCLP